MWNGSVSVAGSVVGVRARCRVVEPKLAAIFRLVSYWVSLNFSPAARPSCQHFLLGSAQKSRSTSILSMMSPSLPFRRKVRKSSRIRPCLSMWSKCFCTEIGSRCVTPLRSASRQRILDLTENLKRFLNQKDKSASSSSRLKRSRYFFLALTACAGGATKLDGTGCRTAPEPEGSTVDDKAGRRGSVRKLESPGTSGEEVSGETCGRGMGGDKEFDDIDARQAETRACVRWLCRWTGDGAWLGLWAAVIESGLSVESRCACMLGEQADWARPRY